MCNQAQRLEPQNSLPTDWRSSLQCPNRGINPTIFSFTQRSRWKSYERNQAIVLDQWEVHRKCTSSEGEATRSISFLPFGRSQGSSLIDHLRQRELTTAQDLNFIILPIFRKKSIMNPATLWSDSQADTFVRSFSTNFTAGTGMLSIWVMKTMHAGIFLAKPNDRPL